MSPSRFLLSNSTNHSIAQYLSYKGLSDSYQSFLSQVDLVSIPRSVRETLQNLLWVSAMNARMDALEHNRTWDLVALREGEHTVGCKWVFSVKYLTDGSVDYIKLVLLLKALLIFWVKILVLLLSRLLN